MKPPVIQLRSPDGWYVFPTDSRDVSNGRGPHHDLVDAILDAIGVSDGVMPELDTDGFSTNGITDSFLEFAARSPSQYDGTCRALAAELILNRMLVKALKHKLLGLTSKDFSA